MLESFSHSDSSCVPGAIYMQIFDSKSKRVSVETINIGITSEVYNVDLRTFFKSKLCNDSK